MLAIISIALLEISERSRLCVCMFVMKVAEKCTADSPYDIEPPTVITNLCEQDVQQSAPRPAAAAQCLQSAVHGMWRPRMCY